MRCLSIRQPWASLIISGVKNIENRSWATAYRGPLAIHAGLKMDGRDITAARELCAEIGAPFPAELPRGGIIGVVTLTGILEYDGTNMLTDHPTIETIDATWFTGPVGWIVECPHACEFVPYSGRLRLFDIPADTLIGIPRTYILSF